jgi:hypothetical protein
MERISSKIFSIQICSVFLFDFQKFFYRVNFITLVAPKSSLYEFGWDGAHGAYTEIDIENGIAVYFGCGTSGINALVHPDMRNLIHEVLETE